MIKRRRDIESEGEDEIGREEKRKEEKRREEMREKRRGRCRWEEIKEIAGEVGEKRR